MNTYQGLFDLINSIGENPTQAQDIIDYVHRHHSTKMWETEIWALFNEDYDSPWPEMISRWKGPPVPGSTIEEAQEYCNKNGLGYCRVIGDVTK